MSDIRPQRGHIYRMAMGHGPALTGIVVSSDALHQSSEDCVAALVVTDTNPVRLPTWVQLGDGDPKGGYVVARHIKTVRARVLMEELGQVSAETMEEVDRALKLVLGL